VNDELQSIWKETFWPNRGTFLAFAWNQGSWYVAKIHTGYLLKRGRAYTLNHPAQ